MSLQVSFNGFWDEQTKARLEQAIRASVGEPPSGEEWSIAVDRSFSHLYCDVQVKTQRQSRKRLFFEEPPLLPQAISDWLRSYPLA
jgi:hypothetical protein